MHDGVRRQREEREAAHGPVLRLPQTTLRC